MNSVVRRFQYPPPRWIFVDVDGTFTANPELVAGWARAQKNAGMTLVLWSSRGQQHAREWAVAYKCDDVFECIISKPGYILDDKGWGWIKYTRLIRRISMPANSAVSGSGTPYTGRAGSVKEKT